MTTSFKEPISSSFATQEIFKNVFNDQLNSEISRQRIISVTCDYLNSVEFMTKIRQYASMEIDSRMFRNMQYWLVAVLTSMITTIVAIIIGKLLKV